MARLESLATMVRNWDNPKKIGHNTKAWRDETGSFSIRYHSTVVVSWDAATQILFVNTNGWFSVTTLQRIRHGLFYVDLWLDTQDIKGKWRIRDHSHNAFTMRGNSIKLRKTNDGWVRVID